MWWPICVFLMSQMRCHGVSPDEFIYASLMLLSACFLDPHLPLRILDGANSKIYKCSLWFQAPMWALQTCCHAVTLLTIFKTVLFLSYLPECTPSNRIDWIKQNVLLKLETPKRSQAGIVGSHTHIYLADREAKHMNMESWMEHGFFLDKNGTRPR